MLHFPTDADFQEGMKSFLQTNLQKFSVFVSYAATTNVFQHFNLLHAVVLLQRTQKLFSFKKKTHGLKKNDARDVSR